MYNAEDVAFTNSKAKLDEVIPTREVIRKADGARVMVDDRQFNDRDFREINAEEPAAE